jgi:hypothetical protein
MVQPVDLWDLDDAPGRLRLVLEADCSGHAAGDDLDPYELLRARTGGSEGRGREWRTTRN